MKETEVTARIARGLNGVMDCYARKRPSGKFSSGDPDLAGCFRGKAFFIETKVTGGELTELQAIQLEKWRKAGAKTMLAVYDKVTRVLKFIQLSDSEKWDDFSGHAKLVELFLTSVSFKQDLKKFDYHALMNQFV